MRVVVLPAIAILSACTVPGARPEPASPSISLSFAADSLRSERIADGVARHFIYVASGPWAINVLDVSRDACYSAVAVKGFPGAVGRKRTSQLLVELDSSGTVVGGVNADFFSPNGTPANAHVSRGRIVTGPSRQALLVFDSVGRPHITRLSAKVEIPNHAPLQVGALNRPVASGIATFDANWGRMTDSASNAIEIVLDSANGGFRVTAIDTATSGVLIPRAGVVHVIRGPSRDSLALPYRDTMGRSISFSNRFSLDAMRPGVRAREAVGGRPVLVRDSAIVPEVDTEGAAGFATSRHPRTAVGIAANGTRLLLITVDGRQKPYSDGMTLRELANLMLALGARDAINLDGGGSTTLVYKEPRSRQLTIANRPSDPTGERAVGNALAVIRGCAR